MKIGITGLFMVLIILTFSLCDKKESKFPRDIYNKWVVSEYLSIESVVYTKDDDFSPLVEFKKDKTIAIQLDVNSCFSDFELRDFDEIEIGKIGCTKICCDSDFSAKIVEMLPQVTSYEIEENKLKLYVPKWGWINLVLVSN